ncbi:hypothetical protein B4N89_23950 [Embleya scabrispora]|uniref:Peptidase M48 domain-containing protein n=1 Tax=Embleya scabrispora TaxID=159449 RepID=A0A1T3P3B9_9ACTN|nr:hypothetical protein [Embleya scabrispora]OPC83587.1 hypothetical protein B4N89_23950 [Embleya scabrispora]
MLYGLVLTAFAAAILVTAPRVLRRAERSGFSPRHVQRAWRAAAGGVLASFALAVPVYTPDLWQAPMRAAGFDPGIGMPHVPLPAQITVAVLALLLVAFGWHRGAGAMRDYRRALRVQLDRLENSAPLLDEEDGGRPRLVIVEDEAPRLVLLPSRPPRVEATTRALDLLRPEELNAVLTHMAGHLRRRDAQWMVCADTLADAYSGVRFFADWADHAAELSEKAADADVRGSIARANLRRAIVKLSGPGQAGGPFCPCFAWPQQRQEELIVHRTHAAAHPEVAVAGVRVGAPVASAGLRVLTAAALLVPSVIVLSPHFLYI